MTACVYGILLTASPFIEYVRIQQEKGGAFRMGRGFTKQAAVTYTFLLAFSIGIGNVLVCCLWDARYVLLFVWSFSLLFFCFCVNPSLSFFFLCSLFVQMMHVSLSVAAVGLLLSWHIYLIGTAQTTIEFYGNTTRAHRARLRGLKYQNP
jgi:hypothetical protein